MTTVTEIDRMTALRRIKRKAGDKLPNRQIAAECGVQINAVHGWLNLGKETKVEAIKAAIDRFIAKHASYLK